MVGGRGRERSRTTRRYNSFDETRTCGEVLFKCQRGVQANEKSAKKKKKKRNRRCWLGVQSKAGVDPISSRAHATHTGNVCARRWVGVP